MKKMTPWRPSHTTVAAYLSLFLVLTGGAAYAAGKIGSGQLKKNAVTAAKIRKGAVSSAKLANGAVGSTKLGDAAVTSTKLGAGAVTSAKIAANAVGGAQADEASFQGLVKGNGTVTSRAFNVVAKDAETTPVVLADIPGFGQIRLIYCGSFLSVPKDQMGVLLESAAGSQPFTFVARSEGSNLPGGTQKPTFLDHSGGIVSDGGGGLSNAQLPGVEAPGPFGIVGKWDYQLFRGEGSGAATVHVSISAYDDSRFQNEQGACHITAETVVQQ